MNIKDLIKQKEKLDELKKELEQKENDGIETQVKHKVYIIEKDLEIIDTKETRIQQKLEEECSHPVLWVINYNLSNREYIDDNHERKFLWYYCMHCGKIITDKRKPKTEYILTAPFDLNYVYYHRKQLLPEIQEEYFNIIKEAINEKEILEIKDIDEKLNKKFNKQKIKSLF